MTWVKIFVEGEADRKFLQDYISKIYDKKLDDNDIVITNGWSAIYSKKVEGIINGITNNSRNGVTNLLILDADNNYQKRCNEITKWKEEKEKEEKYFNFHLFLLPNNQDEGDLESLLEKIINPSNADIFDCWDQYEKCLETKSNRTRPLTLPAKKGKIYAYLESLVGGSQKEKKKIKERTREYGNDIHWDLDSKNLEPLKKFLDKYIM